MSITKLSPDEIIKKMQDLFGKQLIKSEIKTRQEGLKQNPGIQIWLTIDKAVIKPMVKAISDIHYPHLAVISGCDVGEAVELNYHLYIYYGDPLGEYNITIKTALPKNDLTIDTITGIIPGAVVSEREKQEFFGLKVNDIPDERRMFLPDDFPENVYPWRKDETGIQENMVKKLYEVGKEEGKKRREAVSRDAV